MKQQKEIIQKKEAPEMVKAQKITGLVALLATMFVLAGFFLLPGDLVSKKEGAITVGATIVVVIIYYSIPALYLNKKLLVAMDVWFGVAISLIVYFAKEFGLSFIIFYYWVMAIDALLYSIGLYSRKQYLSVMVIYAIAIVILAVFFPIYQYKVQAVVSMIHLASFVTVSVALLMMAQTMIREKEVRMGLTDKLKGLNLTLEDKVKQRTTELQERVNELEKFHRLTVGRELKMAKLKKEVSKMEALARDTGVKTKQNGKTKTT